LFAGRGGNQSAALAIGVTIPVPVPSSIGDTDFRCTVVGCCNAAPAAAMVARSPDRPP
jgi:hypothetical protein